MKQLNITVETSRKHNTAVTHAARNMRAQTVAAITNDESIIKASISNRTMSATSRYLTEKQRKMHLRKGILDSTEGSQNTVRTYRNRKTGKTVITAI
jgi:predicted DNA-binding protein (UPF0278 family)